MPSNIRWIAAAPAIAQVQTLTVGGTPALGQTYSATFGPNSSAVVIYTATGTDTNITIAAALQALLAASNAGQFQAVSWTVSSNVITATANTPGRPFTFTPAASGTGTLVAATVTANSSPNDVGNAANYSTNALPITGDTLNLDHSSESLLYNLDALSAVTLAALNIDSTFTGTIGLPEVNSNQASSYEEYLPTYLAVGATLVNIGFGDGNGSPAIKLNTGSVQTTIMVRQLAQSNDPSLAEAFQWKGTHVSNTVEILRGTAAIAGYGADTATVATLTVGYVTNPASDVFVRVGSGVTLTTLNQSGGTVELNCAATTITKSTGTLSVAGTGAVTTLNAYDGTTNWWTTGTLTTLVVGATEVFSVAEDTATRTISATTIYAGGSILDRFKTVTSWGVNGIQFAAAARYTDCTIDVGLGRKLIPG